MVESHGKGVWAGASEQSEDGGPVMEGNYCALYFSAGNAIPLVEM